MNFGCDIKNDELCLLGIVNIIVSAVSFMGSTVLVLVYICQKNIRTFAFKLVVYIMLTDMVFEISCFMNLFRLNKLRENDDTLCKLQAYLINFSQISSLIWTSLIVYSLYSTLLKNVKELQKQESRYIFAATIFPLLLSVVQAVKILFIFLQFFFQFNNERPWITQKYGMNQSYGICWIQNKLEQEKNEIELFVYEVIFLYIPLWLVIFYNFWAYHKILKFAREQMENQQQIKLLKKLSLYPWAILICFFPSQLERVLEMFQITPHQSLRIIGLFNAIIYGLTDNIKNFLRSLICQQDTQQRDDNPFNSNQRDAANRSLISQSSVDD